MKTKLGVSVGLMGAALYLSAYFSSYIAIFLLAGYVLLFEENPWLKQTAVKAVAVSLMFSVAIAVVGFVPDVIDVIDDVFSIFNGSFHITIISNLVFLVTDVLLLVQKLLMIVLGLTALNQGNMKIPFVDDLIEKHMKSAE